jgi:hypothetical protein
MLKRENQKSFSLKKKPDKYNPEELTLIEASEINNDKSVSDLAKEYLEKLDD